MPILHDQEYFVSCMELPSKDFLKKCETYLRLKANGSGRPAMPLSPASHPGTSSMGNLATIGRSGDNLTSPRLDRMGSSPPAEAFMRNGHRQQSPQSAQRSHHPNGPSPSLSQGVASVHSPQPRAAAPFDEYNPSRPAPIPAGTPRSVSRPNSLAPPSRTESETPHGTPPGTGMPGTPRL